MTIRRKTLWAVGLTFLILLIFLTVILRIVVFKGFLQLESRNVELNVERGINTLAEMLANMDTTAADWASWNDTYEFLGNRNPEYIENNLVDETVTTLKVNFMLFFDADQRLVMGKQADLVSKTAIPLADDVTEAVAAAVASGIQRKGRADQKGILMIGGVPALVVSRPILKSDDTGPARGALVLGKYLDQKEIRRVSEMMHLSIETYPVKEAQRLFPSDELQLLKDGKMIQKARDKQFIAGYAIQKDFYGNPAFILKVELPRNIFQQGQKVLIFSIISLVITCLVFSLVIALFLEKLVLVPLNRLSHRVAGIGEKFDSYVPFPVERKDELGKLAKKINRMLEQIHEKTTELEEANAALKKDVVARILVEQTLKESEKRYRSILDAVPNAISIHGAEDQQYKEVNEGFTRVMGYHRDEVIGKTVSELNGYVDEEDRFRIAEQFRREGQITGMNLQLRMKDGRILDTLLSARPMIYDDEACAVMSVVDDTNRKHMENEKNKLEGQLQQAQKMESIGNLAGGIAHDFNNILSSIIGYAELAEDFAEKESVLHRYLKAVLAAGDRAKDLVRQILTFARQADVEEKPVRVKYLVNESLKLMRASIPSSIAIKRNIESNSHIWANPTQIHQVIMNLCTNAAQAMEAQGGTLTVELKDVLLDGHVAQRRLKILPGKYLLLSVRDTGPGIMPDAMEKIFDPYFTTKETGRGTGLGLSVVKGIVDGCHGVIEVHSRIGQGAQFDVWFPVLELEGKEKATPDETQNLPTGDERILFVDDEPTIASIQEQMLMSLGYQVVVKTSPVEALALFTADPDGFDLIISDITMPDMTGDVLAGRVLKIRPDIPVILCSGYSKRISDERAKEIGVKAFLSKPVGKIQMAETIRKVIDGA